MTDNKPVTKIGTINLVVGADKINAATDKLAKGLGDKQKEAHKLALSVLHHVGQHKDVSVVERFVKVLPEMIRTNGLRNWFEQFGPVKFTVLEDGTEKVAYVKDKKTMLGNAYDKPFWKFSAREGQPYQPLDTDKLFEQVIKRLETDAVKAGVDHTARLAALRLAKANVPVVAATVQ